jgi:prepilin-type N-terminal cleavage/methylation domain-containing protein
MIRTPSKIIGEWRKGKKGFTLIEVLLASAIFSVVALIGALIFTDVARIQRKIYLESALYEDGRFLMERIARAIRQNAVDYDEYYNKAVKNAAFGQYFGCYATRFYNRGSDGMIGAKCSAKPVGGNPVLNPGCVINKKTLDINTGRNPYMGIDGVTTDGKLANAFCDKKYYPGSSCIIDAKLYKRDQLYLIDAKGQRKTFIALKKVTDMGGGVYENALSVLELQGLDTNKDGVTEKWYDSTKANYYCLSSYDCAPANFNLTGALEDTLDASGINAAKLWKGFVPISPLRSNVKSLRFYVSPLEDPRKAFAETDPAEAMLQQPHVTVIMTLEPTAAQIQGYGGTPPYLTLQTTVSSRVYNEVKSYTGTASCPDYL